MDPHRHHRGGRVAEEALGADQEAVAGEFLNRKAGLGVAERSPEEKGEQGQSERSPFPIATKLQLHPDSPQGGITQSNSYPAARVVALPRNGQVVGRGNLEGRDSGWGGPPGPGLLIPEGHLALTAAHIG